MLSMKLTQARGPLVPVEERLRPLRSRQVRVQVLACGVCRTDLHLLDGDLPNTPYPITPGHEIVGRVCAVGPGADRFRIGDRVGIPWLGFTCGECPYCVGGRENLCDRARFTGYTIDGGYAEYALADERYCLAIPASYSDAAAAPLLCAGLIGYRAYKAAGDAANLGFYGFGAAAHLLCQIAAAQGRNVFAFTRPGDQRAQRFARDLGAVWAGGADQRPRMLLDAAIIFAPAGDLVPVALAAIRKGGKVICAGIHMSDIPSFSYDLLWGERAVASVANLTRMDGEEFMKVAADLELKPSVECFGLRAANQALARLRDGTLNGAAVLLAAGADPHDR